MTPSSARVAFAALLGLTVLGTAVQELLPTPARAEEPPQRPTDGSGERPKPRLPERQQPAPAPAPAPSSSLPTPGVNPAENLPPDQLSPVTNDELFGDPDEMIEGTNVHLEDLVVRAKSGLLLRAADDRHEIFVAPIDPSWLDFLTVGAHIDIRGTLRASPSARQAKLVFAMSTREAKRLARTPVYVDAWSLTAR